MGSVHREEREQYSDSTFGIQHQSTSHPTPPIAMVSI